MSKMSGAVMTDAWMIEVIAKRLDEECGFDKASTILNHSSWVDVVTHLWTDKKLKAALMEAYQAEIVNARAQELLSESDSLPL